MLSAALSNLVLNTLTAPFLPVAPVRAGTERGVNFRLGLGMGVVLALTAFVLAAAVAAHFYPGERSNASTSLSPRVCLWQVPPPSTSALHRARKIARLVSPSAVLFAFVGQSQRAPAMV
eukprot:SAG11_NODE_1081_length_5956_cov_14.482506_8_plen_119_part_00